jgi:hypothetical protein
MRPVATPGVFSFLALSKSLIRSQSGNAFFPGLLRMLKNKKYSTLRICRTPAIPKNMPVRD